MMTDNEKLSHETVRNFYWFPIRSILPRFIPPVDEQLTAKEILLEGIAAPVFDRLFQTKHPRHTTYNRFIFRDLRQALACTGAFDTEDEIALDAFSSRYTCRGMVDALESFFNELGDEVTVIRLLALSLKVEDSRKEIQEGMSWLNTYYCSMNRERKFSSADITAYLLKKYATTYKYTCL